MKKIFLVLFATIVLFLAGCTKEGPTSDINTAEIGTQLATSVFMAQGFFTNSNATLATSNSVLSSSVELESTDSEVERNLDQFMLFFDMMNVFLEGSPQTSLNIEQEASTKDDFESMVSYEVNGVTHIIHYNIVDASKDNDLDEQEFTLTGILITNNDTFEVKGGTELEDGELEMYFETHDKDSSDYIRVEIEKELNEQFFQIDSFIDGVDTYSEIHLEKDGIEGALEINIWDGQIDTTIEITKETEGADTIYFFEYSIGSIYGSITLTITTNENGEEVRHFAIEEGDFFKEFTETTPSTVSNSRRTI